MFERLSRRADKARAASTLAPPRVTRRLRRLVCHERLGVRFAALGILAAAALLAAWTVSYLALPEGVLRGRTAAAALAGTEAAASFWAEWARLAAVNLVVGTLPVLANSTFAYRGYPLGYLLPLLWAALYGVTLGTNSFTIPLRQRMAPSLLVFGRSGIYEIGAYVLVAAATYTLSCANVTRFFPPTSTLNDPRPHVRRAQWVGVGLAIALLLAASAWEAFGIIAVAEASP
jgi:hypothetical protein